MKSLIVFFLILYHFKKVEASCSFSTPTPYPINLNPVPMTCGIPRTLRWNQSTPLSPNLEGWVHFVTGTLDALWFTGASPNLNGSKTTSFDCNYRKASA